MINLLIARHGNTFDAGEILLRVGRGTDIPLSNSGRLQAMSLGQYLQQHHPEIAVVYTSTLQRTKATAEIALQTMGSHVTIHSTPLLDEIDYGPDEGKPETDVVARLGETALAAWDQDNIVPQGWIVNPEHIKNTWCEFAQEMEQVFPEQTILVVTSNGTARFAPGHAVKLKTGALSHLAIEQGQWRCIYANHRPT